MARILNRRGRPAHPEILTPSERQVLAHLRAGRTNAEIAEDLGITFHTVKFHISNMLSKLYLKDRRELAAWDERAVAGEHHQRRRQFAFLSLSSLKTLGMASAATTGLVALAAGAILAVGTLRGGEDASASEEPPVVARDPALSGAIVEATEARTKLEIKVAFPTEPSEAPPDVRLEVTKVTAITPNGVVPVSLRSVGSESSDGRQVVLAVEAEPLPPGTSGVEVQVARRKHFQSHQDQLVDGPWFLTMPTAGVPLSRELTSLAPATIDTGFGWEYVIDNVHLTGSTLSVTYHAEGEIEGLVRVLQFGPPRPRAEFNGAAKTTIEVPVPAGAESVSLEFAGAARYVKSPQSLTFARQPFGWEAGALSIEGNEYTLAISEVGAITATVHAAGLVVGMGGVEDEARLIDNLGNEYRFQEGRYPGDGSVEWTFSGVIHPGATTVTLTFGGYAIAETGDWAIKVPLD